MDQTAPDGATEPVAVEQAAGGRPSGTALSERRRFAVRYLRARRQARRFYLILKGLVGLGLRVGGAAAGMVLLVMLCVELTRHRIEIQPIAVPRSLAEAGYSPEVAALRLRDAMDDLAGAAAEAGGQALAISMHDEAPEIVVPTVGISISTLATYLRRFLGYSPRMTIAGEITQLDGRLSLSLRLDGQIVFRSREAVAADRPDNIWPQAAQALMLEISPYRAALALYDADPEKAMGLVDSIVRRYPPTDENVAWARLVRGLHHRDFLQYGTAEVEFRDVLRQAADAAAMWPWRTFAVPVSYLEPAQFYLGLTVLNRGNPEAAEAELRQAIRLDPNDPAAHHYLGMALKALKRADEANAQFMATRRIYDQIFAGLADGRGHGPGSASTHVSFGNALLEEQRYDEALEQFDWAVKLDPDSDSAHRGLCDGLREAKRVAEAMGECKLAAERAPRRAENQISLAKVLIEKRDLESARRAAEEALRLAPESPQAHEALGLVHERGGDGERAVAAYQAALRLAPDIAAFHADLGNALYEDAKFAEAADAHRKAVAFAPDSGAAHANLALALARLKDLDGAIGEYQTAIGLEPGNAEWRNALGNLYFEKRDFAAAAAAYRAGLAVAPQDATMHRNLAEALAEQQDLDGAIREYNEALGRDAGNDEWWNALGDLHYKEDDFAAAAEAYWKAVALAPNDAVSHRNLGNALRRQERFEAAIDEYRKAIALAPADPLAQNYLGMALEGRDPLGSEAVEAYRAALALDPTEPAPYYNLAVFLKARAMSAESEASRLELLAQACRLLIEGLRQAPDEPHLRQQLAAFAPDLPQSAGCASGR